MSVNVKTRSGVEEYAVHGSEAFKSLAKARILALKRFLENVEPEEENIWSGRSRKNELFKRLMSLIKASLSILYDVPVPASVREPSIENEYDLPLVVEDVAQMLALSGDPMLLRYAERYAVLARELEDII
ncbi:MAG: hypothetical protein JHC26_01405 [Thermofilum sp.]|jgi:hypothetical protein|uniref:hypothetical protein n=1 Tax=Thermofilum sp. TaxID=1961369 RepID=UPI002588A463|nr:hypothetical protein [Thermofilum sp.]MCI4407717.1 hypothetical protein [Thermofilum sp.]